MTDEEAEARGDALVEEMQNHIEKNKIPLEIDIISFGKTDNHVRLTLTQTQDMGEDELNEWVEEIDLKSLPSYKEGDWIRVKVNRVYS